jgi:hypothetical protein
LEFTPSKYLESKIRATLGDESARQYVAAADDTTDNAGLVPTRQLTEVVNGLANTTRSAIDAISRGVLPDAGMSFEIPKITTMPTVAETSEAGTPSETDQASSFLTVTVKKHAGQQTFSVELLDRTSPLFFNELLSNMAAAYAKATDLAVFTALASGASADTTTLATYPTAAELLGFVSRGAASVYANTQGFATNILNRDPHSLISACLKELDDKKYEDPAPWIFGYTGECVKHPDSDNSWIFKGICQIANTSTVKITELPPSITYEKYDSHLNDLEDRKVITGYDNNCKSDINYTLKFNRAQLSELQKKDKLSRLLKLEEKQSENFTVLDEFGKLKIFRSATEIIQYFVKFRLKFYHKRKEYLINRISEELRLISNRARFIQMIIKGKLKVNNVPKKEIIQNLENEKFDLIDGSYNYLLSMQISSLTREKFEELMKLEDQKKKELEQIRLLDPKDMYRDDLKELKKSII